MQRLQSGDKTAFGELYDSYGAALYGVVLKIVGTEEEANDVLQASFVKIWKYAAKYDSKKGSPFTWMLNIARNTAIDALRKRQKTPSAPNQIDVSDVGVNSGKEMNINAIGLKELMAQLPPEQQEVLEYLYFKGYTQQEASDALELPLGTVKTRARTALKKLRSIFQK